MLLNIYFTALSKHKHDVNKINLYSLFLVR